MIKKTNNLIFPLLVMGVFLIFVSSCKKDDDSSKGVPVLTTTVVTSITHSDAISGGNITSEGGATVTARGVCWSTGQTPTISDNKTTDATGTGVFTSNISGLSPNTTYYVRAYAINSNGTGYGNTISFSTGNANTYTDIRDGKVYQTVTIGNQVWMAENLAYLPSVVGPGTGSETTAYYYVYGYSGTNVAEAKATANYITYGVLYNWTAAMAGIASSSNNPSGVQGACPSGWHLPSDAEWTELTDYIGGESDAGGKLKETDTTHWNNPNTGATNEIGFFALPGGDRAISGTYLGIGTNGVWWCATDYDATGAMYRGISHLDSSVGRSGCNKGYGFSVRCVRD